MRMDLETVIGDKYPAVVMADRFRGFMPVVIDVETAGFNADTDALLEIAAVLLEIDDAGLWVIDKIISKHVQPFEGANLDPASMEFTGIDIDHPFRKQIAVSEQQAITEMFKIIRKKMKQNQCKRAILVGHNASFDLGFLNAVVKRTEVKPNPFHLFSCFDTATLAGVAYGQTVLSRAVTAAGLDWDSEQAHSASYDAERTAQLFCRIVNCWPRMV